MVERIAKASKAPVIGAHKGLNMGTDVVRAIAPTWWALPACYASRRLDCVYNSAYIAILNLAILRIAVLKVHATMTKASERGKPPIEHPTSTLGAYVDLLLRIQSYCRS